MTPSSYAAPPQNVVCVTGEVEKGGGVCQMFALGFTDISMRGLTGPERPDEKRLHRAESSEIHRGEVVASSEKS